MWKEEEAAIVNHLFAHFNITVCILCFALLHTVQNLHLFKSAFLCTLEQYVKVSLRKFEYFVRVATNFDAYSHLFDRINFV